MAIVWDGDDETIVVEAREIGEELEEEADEVEAKSGTTKTTTATSFAFGFGLFKLSHSPSELSRSWPPVGRLAHSAASRSSRRPHLPPSKRLHALRRGDARRG